MLKIGQDWGKIANYPPQYPTKICTTMGMILSFLMASVVYITKQQKIEKRPNFRSP